uniref:Uncharacterized protein n=1 Tax=Glossina pallidipes TaxID=7398 RepID=A0A1A9ZY89_GLOPL
MQTVITLKKMRSQLYATNNRAQTIGVMTRCLCCRCQVRHKRNLCHLQPVLFNTGIFYVRAYLKCYGFLKLFSHISQVKHTHVHVPFPKLAGHENITNACLTCITCACRENYFYLNDNDDDVDEDDDA